MEFYPALKAYMGTWEYYIVKMKMRQVAHQINFSTAAYTSRTLDELLQRELNENRVKTEMINFLQNRTDRFFGSLIVAAIGGAPTFLSAEISDSPEFKLLKNIKPLRDTFGVLSFDGEQKYYAVDGQHRLNAIQLALDPTKPYFQNTPEGFGDEEISVLIVVPDIDITADISKEEEQEFLESYRRLFSSLNRYTKKTDNATNIIMDEDDSVAIATRRLIAEHTFFMWDEEADSARIKTKATKTMAERDTEFTNIEILYDMNLLLLNDEQRFSSGWGDDANQSFSEHKTQRPSDQYLENLYQELKLFWDGILLALPSSTESGSAMRNHNYDEDKNPGDLTDDLWFWPIGQLLIIKVARHLLHNLLSPGMPITAEAVNAALSPLSRIPTNLHEAPWRYFALTQGQNKKDGSWTFKMRSEDRVRAMTLGETIAKFIIGTGPSLNHDDIHGPNGIKTLWDGMLISAPITPEEVNGMWHQIETLKLTYQSRVTI